NRAGSNIEQSAGRAVKIPSAENGGPVARIGVASRAGRPYKHVDKIANQPAMDNTTKRAATMSVVAAGFRSLWALAILLMVPSLPAAVRFDVFIGYDGILPEANWFPVACEVHNDGPSFKAVFEVSPAQFNQGQTRVMAVDLPSGTTKRFVIPVFSSSRYVMNWNSRLLDEKGKVRAETTGKQVRKLMQSQMPMAGALARTLKGNPNLPEIKPRQTDLQPIVAHLQPNLLPDNPIALQGLDTLYLNSELALKLDVKQVSALLAWLHAGGHLIV